MKKLVIVLLSIIILISVVSPIYAQNPMSYDYYDYETLIDSASDKSERYLAAGVASIMYGTMGVAMAKSRKHDSQRVYIECVAVTLIFAGIVCLSEYRKEKQKVLDLNFWHQDKRSDIKLSYRF